MGRFLIFIGVTLLLCLIGLGVWWLGNLIWIKIRRAEKKFEIEEEGYEIAKDCIRNTSEDTYKSKPDYKRNWTDTYL